MSLSSEVLPQIKEYERVWTTVVNAYVGPALAGYLARLAERLRGHGYRGERPDHAVARRRGAGRASRRAWPPAPCSRARPAASPAGGTCARLTRRADLVTFDMGGTSTDIALLQGGEPS